MNGRWTLRRRALVVGASFALGAVPIVAAFSPANAVELSTGTPVDTVTAPVTETVTQTEQTVNDTVQQTEQTVNDTVQQVEDTVGGLVDQLPELPVDVPELPDIPPIDIPDIDVPDVNLPPIPELPLPKVPALPNLPVNGLSPSGPSGAGGSGDSSGGSSSSGGGTAATQGARGSDYAQRLRRGPSGPGMRSTAEVIAVLEEVGASEDVVARILAPFPAAGVAEFPTRSRTGGVEIDGPAGTPVVAPVGGTVLDATMDRYGLWTVRLLGADGRGYTFEGIGGAATPPYAGRQFDRAEVMGHLAGVAGEPSSVSFSVDELASRTPAYLGEAVDTALIEANMHAGLVRFGRALIPEGDFRADLASSVRPMVPRGVALAASLMLILSGLGVAWVAPGSNQVAQLGRRFMPAPTTA